MKFLTTGLLSTLMLSSAYAVDIEVTVPLPGVRIGTSRPAPRPAPRHPRPAPRRDVRPLPPQRRPVPAPAPHHRRPDRRVVVVRSGQQNAPDFRYEKVVHLGQLQLQKRNGSDMLYVRSCAGRYSEGALRAIKLKVYNNDAQIDYLSIQYGNGQVEELQVKDYFRAGSQSRWIDLARNYRCVKDIQVVGHSLSHYRHYNQAQSLISVEGIAEKY